MRWPRLRLDDRALEAVHVRRCGGCCPKTHPGSSEEERGSATTSSDRQTLLSLGFTNRIRLDAAGGFVGVLIGLRGVARFLCCFPFVGPVDRGDESDMGEAIALDRRNDRIDRRRHCDNRNLPRRNAGEHANSGGAVDSIFHLRASPIFEHFKPRPRLCVVESDSTGPSSG